MVARRKMEVVGFQTIWKEMFRSEAQLLRFVFGENLTDMQHIGSTSIEGMRAKPTIDMLGIAESIQLIEERADEMRLAGYQSMGEYGLPGRRLFSKSVYFRDVDYRRPLYNVHIYGRESASEIERHLAFRDYLRAHPSRANEYAALKERLASESQWDEVAYMDGKDALVKKIEKEALEWAASGRKS